MSRFKKKLYFKLAIAPWERGTTATDEAGKSGDSFKKAVLALKAIKKVLISAQVLKEGEVLNSQSVEDLITKVADPSLSDLITKVTKDSEAIESGKSLIGIYRDNKKDSIEFTGALDADVNVFDIQGRSKVEESSNLVPSPSGAKCPKCGEPQFVDMSKSFLEGYLDCKNKCAKKGLTPQVYENIPEKGQEGA